MKKLLFAAGFLLSSFAFGEVRNPITEVAKLKYDGAFLDMVYRTGGGCQKHTGQVEVLVDATTKTAEVKVYDSTPDVDACEAYISVGVLVDLKALVAKAVKNAGLNANDLWTVSVKLPAVDVRPFDQ